MPTVHKLFASHTKLELAAVAKDNDIYLTLNQTGSVHEPVQLMFSKCCPISTRKPWTFETQRFQTVSLDAADDRLNLLGRNEYLETRAAVSFQQGLLFMDLTWRCVAPFPLDHAAVGFCLDMHYDLATERLTLPHILYNDNPSADPARVVPHCGKQAGAGLVCEESRFPIPGVNLEWQQEGCPRFLSLFSMPEPGLTEWSLGCHRLECGLQLIGASGIVAFNGMPDEIYGLQRQAVPYHGGYRRLQPGDTLHKTYVLELGNPQQIGWGFRKLVSSGFALLRPKASPCLSLDQVIELKSCALQNRWHHDDHSSGYLCALPDSIYKSPPYYLFGWTGQSMRLAWCSAQMGLTQDNPEWILRARQAVDFYIANSQTPTAGLRYNHYYTQERRWCGEKTTPIDMISSRAHGEATANLGKLVRLFQSAKLDVPHAWLNALEAATDFLLTPAAGTSDGIFPVFWTDLGAPVSDMPSAAGTSCIPAILEAYNLTRNPSHLNGAIALASRYWRQGGDRFDHPFARATLDARCEDKEAGIYFFLAAVELFYATGDTRFKEWAEAAADWIITFVYFWHTGFRPETICAQNGFITTGWPGVSVQNHHLDVFFPAYELYAFGRHIGNAMYQHIGRMVFQAWSHGICRTPGDWGFRIPGEQGEQFFQTNFQQGPAEFDASYWRGGFSPWNPSWIIALVLESALRFKYDPSGMHQTDAMQNRGD